MRRAFLAAVPLALAGGLTACDDAEPKAGSPGPAAPAKGFPALRVTTVVGGLDHPWDVKRIGRGRLLVTERDRARLSLVRHGTRHTIAFPSGKVWVSGETGLLGMAVDPEFADNHRVYLCQGGFPPAAVTTCTSPPGDSRSRCGRSRRSRRWSGTSPPAAAGTAAAAC